ncbi:MAG: hypothetical protein RLZZ444_3225, partial [Pseudomonadota bacterium]
DLIAAIYAATLSPNDFAKVLHDLDTMLFDGEIASDAVLNEATLSHIGVARSIQERIGRTTTEEQRLVAIVESVPNPTYVLSRSEVMLAGNNVARRKYGALPAILGDLITHKDVLRQVRDYLRRGEVGQPLAIAGQIAPPQTSQTSVLVNRIDPAMAGGDADLFLLSIVDFGFDSRVTELFRVAHGLTPAEAQVAVLLASGLRLADIASERGVSVETVRTQIKTIKNKTSVRDLPGLVRLLCGFTASLVVQAGQSGEPGRLFYKARRQIQLSDGRRLDYLEQGAPDGRPVLLFHNLPYGAELPEAAVRQAQLDGLRFIAPYRPGMGLTDPAPKSSPEALLDLAAADCAELLRHLGIGNAIVISHAAGSSFALRFASRHPDKVSRMIALSHAPIWRPHWIADMPQRQRFVTRLARHFPQVLPVVAWAMITCMESRQVNEFVRYNCRDGKSDAKAVESQETIDLIAKGSIYALHKSVASFSLECLIAQMDFVAEARACPHKFHILHGEDDQIIRLYKSQTFVDEVPGTTIEVVPDAGQLLFFSHWPRMLSAIKIPPMPASAPARLRVLL